MALAVITLLILPLAARAEEEGPESLLHPRQPHAWDTSVGRAINGRRYPYRYYLYYPPYIYPPHHARRKPWYKDELPAPAGRLLVLVDPVEAEVYVDGYPLKRHADLSYEVGLLEGEYLLEVRAVGYQAYEQIIQIRGAKYSEFIIRLDPSQSGSE